MKENAIAQRRVSRNKRIRVKYTAIFFAVEWRHRSTPFGWMLLNKNLGKPALNLLYMKLSVVPKDSTRFDMTRLESSKN
jgi:hypothetical protein